MTGKGLLIIKSDHCLSQENSSRIREAMDPICRNLGLVCAVLDNGLDAMVSYDLSPLVAAIQAQTEAINALAASNHQLIQAMAEGDGVEPQPMTYLDGKRRDNA